MAYDEQLAERIRDEFTGLGDVVARKMFGGIAFMVAGNMAVGIIGDDLMVRVGPDAYDEALALPHTGPMQFTGRPMKGMVLVEPAGVAEASGLRTWVDRGVDFARSLPAK